MLLTNRLDQIHPSRKTVKFSRNHQFHIRIHLKGLFQSYGIHVPRGFLCINEYWNTPFINDGIQCGIKSHVRAEYTFSFKRTVTNGRLSIQRFAGVLDSKVKRGGAAGQAYSILHTCLFRSDALDFIDVFTDRTHPVSVICLLDVLHLVAVHRRRGKPNFLFESFHIFT